MFSSKIVFTWHTFLSFQLKNILGLTSKVLIYLCKQESFFFITTSKLSKFKILPGFIIKEAVLTVLIYMPSLLMRKQKMTIFVLAVKCFSMTTDL